jgi:hypothetical protein
MFNFCSTIILVAWPLLAGPCAAALSFPRKLVAELITPGPAI